MLCTTSNVQAGCLKCHRVSPEDLSLRPRSADAPPSPAWIGNRCGRVFVSSQVDLLLMHSHFLLIVPLYVLLGRCSVILSRAGCLYNPRTEIWLARPECLSFFRLPPSPPLLRSSLSPFIPTVSSSSYSFSTPSSACLPHPLRTSLGDEISSRATSAELGFFFFFHVKPCVFFKSP